MLHHYIGHGPDASHWAANTNSDGTKVLAQVGEANGDMSRVILTPDQAEEFANALRAAASRARGKAEAQKEAGAPATEER